MTLITFVPIVLYNRAWAETYKATADPATIFPGPVSEWTANQRRLVCITKEYFGLFSAMNQRGHEPPKTEAIDTYRPEKGTRLATYAARCIENEISMAIISGVQAAGLQLLLQ